MTAAEQAILMDRWKALCTRLELRDGKALFELLFSRYTARERRYHNIHHIASSLDELDRVRSQCANCDAVELAIWFHDVACDAKRSDNEERSAQIAREQLCALGAPQHLIEQVTNLILITTHSMPPRTSDEQLIMDIDLVPLGAPADVFDISAASIRQEYGHLDDAAYTTGRAQLLRRFLERPRIYATDVFADRYERQARLNLQRSIGSANGQSQH